MCDVRQYEYACGLSPEVFVVQMIMHVRNWVVVTMGM